MTKIIHDITTNEITEVELTEQELSERQTKIHLHLIEQQRLNAELEIKTAARQAVLNKLGLTAEEVAALLT